MDRVVPRSAVLLVVLAASLPYLATIDDYFTQDDFGVVQLLASKPWSTFPRWFVMPWMENIWGFTPDEIRPFVAFTYQVSALPGAGRPELHHLVNILFHAANAVLVMALAVRAVGLSLPAATVAGVIFGLLPVHSESVAWITGRVDSMPALLYFATVLAYVRWRQSSDQRAYHAALGFFFLALFSKQNTITMVATLATYDVLIAFRERRGAGWPRWMLNAGLAWLPFALMTAGYLLLRRLLFGASVRGGLESFAQLTAAAEMSGRHLLRTVFGHTGPLAPWEIAGLVAVCGSIAWLVMRERRWLAAVLCFGVAWWIIGVAPVLVAGYESPRHVYLAAAAWAWMLGAAFEGMRGGATLHGRAARAIPVAVVAAIALVYAVRLHGEVGQWGRWADVAESAVAEVNRTAERAEEGTLLLVSVPRKSWDWATPFVLQPPYAPHDLSRRVNLVTSFRLHCCGPEQWNAYTRRALADWMERPEAPVIALHFAESGAVSRLTGDDSPALRVIARELATTESWENLNESVVRLMDQLVRK